MARTFGVKQIMKKKYKLLPFDGEWEETFGQPSDPFTMLVFGHPKNGKTEFMMKYAKYLTRFGKVWYNSVEQGDSKSIQDAFVRNQMDKVNGFMLGDRYYFEDMMIYLAKPKRGKFIFLDSRDYLKLTTQQWEKLVAEFPNKSFILLCWEKGGHPKGEYAKDIRFQVDIVVHVKNFKAHVESRFGGGKTFVIWDKKAAEAQGEQLKLQVA
jgi:hypothetical protein